MNILIKNLSNTYNYGSMMMGENLITYLLKELKQNVNFFVDSETEDNINRLKEATAYNNIYCDKLFDYTIFTKKIPILRYFERKIRESIILKKCKNLYDAVFILGGDDYSELYYDIPEESKHIINLLSFLQKLNKKTKLFMLGQTVGPYTGKRLEKAKRVFKNIKIYTRDDINNKYLDTVMGVKAIKMRDIAFLDLNLQKKYDENFKDILNKYKISENKYIVIVGSGLMHHYSKNINEVASKTIEIIKKVKKNNKNCDIVWLTHVSGKTKSDSKMLNLMKNINPKLMEKLIIIDEEMLPVKARIILGHSVFNISFRMHAAVSTFQMGKPCICLSYSPKYKGVIGNGLNMNELLIECKNVDYWKKDNNVLEKQIIKINDYINNNYNKLLCEISNNVTECKKIDLEVIKEICQEVSNHD